MGRPPLRTPGEGTEVESGVCKDRRQKVCYLAERTGRGNPTVHMILKSALKMTQTSERCIAHNHAVVIILNFPTSLVIQMACAGGRDEMSKMSAQNS